MLPGFLSTQMKQSKTPKRLYNNRQKTTSCFYRKTTAKVRFQRSKGAKIYVLGVQIHTTPGFLSIHMKQSKTPKQLVNNRQKTTSRSYRKTTVQVRFQRSKGVKIDAFGVQIYSCLGFLSIEMQVVFLSIINECFDYFI